MKVLYITGHSFCGSTLAAFVLNCHPEMVSIGEPAGPIDQKKNNRGGYICSCGETLSSCNFWNNIYQQMEWQGQKFSPYNWNLDYRYKKSRMVNILLTRNLPFKQLENLRDNLLYALPSYRNWINSVTHRSVLAYETILSESGKKVFVDAQKDVRRAQYLSKQPGLDFKLVHLLRDAPAYVNSFMKHNDKFDLNTLRFASKYWLRTIKRAERLRDKLNPDCSILVRYEDLCINIENELERITTLVGLQPFELPVQYRDYEHHVIGNSMRKGETSSIVLDEKWKTTLSETQISEIRKITDPVRKKYGYI